MFDEKTEVKKSRRTVPLRYHRKKDKISPSYNINRRTVQGKSPTSDRDNIQHHCQKALG
jgi:hypothetical protein